MRIDGKTVLVTGGARRVGANIVRAFAAEEADVILHVRHSREEAAELAASLPRPERCRILMADFAVPGAAAKLFAECGQVDILVNNASMFETDELVSGNEAHDREQFEVNFWSPLALMRAFAAQELPEGGAIVNLLDQEVTHRSAHGGAYALSRRALADATLELARELGPRNLRVNAVAPGPVLPPPWLPDGKMAKTIPTLPLRRKVELDDLTSAVLFLCRNDSITGQILCVDCGQSL
ncbi:SDR family oxidoreductase [uncultured Victivallis sp.]|uniref:SDR family oxidoreductase n=1 Tax=uncultured Victivallis sp. TaxID=354118 RepID=UPI0025DC2898|nr:SDR family oxidoreductase [uncultured Victivallis sp.]